MKSCWISCTWMKLELASHGLWSQSGQIQCLWAIPWCNSSWWATDWSKQTGEDWTDKNKLMSHELTKANRWGLNWQKQTGEPWTDKNWWEMNSSKQTGEPWTDEDKLVSNEVTITNSWAMNWQKQTGEPWTVKQLALWTHKTSWRAIDS